MDHKEIGRIFYRDGFRLALEHLEGTLHPAVTERAISELYKAVDSLLEAFLKRSEAEGRRAECRKGCAWCCHQAVYAVTHEVLYLRAWVGEHFRGEEQTAFQERAREKSLASLNRELDEQLKLRIPCPFLWEGACAVYPARPMACRIYLSWSEKACLRVHGQPGGKLPLRELFEFPLTAGRMLNEGFVAGLKQRGLASTELPLEQGYATAVTLGQDFGSWIG